MLKPIVLLVLTMTVGWRSFESHAGAFESPMIEFSADTLETRSNGARMLGKLFVGNHAYRREFIQAGKPIIEIVKQRSSKPRVWILFPDEKKYFMRRGGVSPNAFDQTKTKATEPCRNLKKEVSCKNLGVEILNGRETEKWELKTTHKGQTLSTVQWLDRVRGMIIKQVFPGGSSEFRLIGKDEIAGRETEKWEHIQKQDLSQKTIISVYWYDPVLRFTLREELPGGGVKELDNIQQGPQPDSLFELPQGYTQTSMPKRQPGKSNGTPGVVPGR
jgi:hypothetical protein